MPKNNSQRSSPNTIRNSSDENNALELSVAKPNQSSSAKPKRVRTGCLTCRQRHLKCDEGLPSCQNCKKSSRECRRGVRLNFIDTKCEQPPQLLPRAHDWKITFEDNSREIASEYEGGIEKYAYLETPRKRRRLSPPGGMYGYDHVNGTSLQDQHLHAQSYASFPDSSALYPPSGTTGFDDHASTLTQSYPDQQRSSFDQQMFSPQDLEPPGLPLSGREEVLYMQVFVEEVGLFMDSMDKDKHFSRILPFQALREPMLKFALLACGVRHLTLVNQSYPEEHALRYYAESNKLLLKSLQNPNRDTALCATTASILNVYEVMSEKALQRMNHIAGARALIKECQWDGTTPGVGGACFWLNVGLELFSCLHFNWGVAWDPDTWGIDMTMNPQQHAGNEEDWTHKILWILAKVTNFRSTMPRFQESNMHAEEMRLRGRYQQWLGLKQFCDRWEKCVPPTMHAMAIVPSYQARSQSAFPEVWYIKRTTIVARLFWHTALVLLGAVHPIAPWSSSSDTSATTNPQLAAEMAQLRLHHAQQICGIVKHAKDRGIASVSIRCLAVAGEHLHDHREQEEVLEMFEHIKKDAGWRVQFINDELKEKWGWNNNVNMYNNSMSQSSFYPPGSSAPTMPAVPQQSQQRQKPQSGITNPLYKNADFASQNPPYAGNWVPANPNYLGHHSSPSHGNGTDIYRSYGAISAL